MNKSLALLASLIAWPAAAGELTAMQGGSLDLAAYQGVVYYTQEGSDFRVVATLARDDGTPIRFVTTLAADQHLIISVPGKAGETEQTLEIARVGGKLVVDRSAAALQVAETVSQ